MVFVVGAVGIDLVAVRERFLDGTSNPSDIRLGLGGVGYRIFTNLETPRRFVTALASDPVSRWARETLESDGDVSILEVGGKEARPPLYLALMESGSLKVAASDFRLVEQALTPSFVERAVGDPGPSDFLVLDANLSPRLLAGLVERYGRQTRIVFEPVSVEKAAQHRSALRGLFLLTPTTEELESLGVGDVGRFLEDRGIQHLLLTRGAEGVRLFSGGSSGGVIDFAPRTVVRAADTTGAGDLLLASLLNALHAGVDMPAAVRAAMDVVEKRLQGESSS